MWLLVLSINWVKKRLVNSYMPGWLGGVKGLKHHQGSFQRKFRSIFQYVPELERISHPAHLKLIEKRDLCFPLFAHKCLGKMVVDGSILLNPVDLTIFAVPKSLNLFLTCEWNQSHDCSLNSLKIMKKRRPFNSDVLHGLLWEAGKNGGLLLLLLLHGKRPKGFQYVGSTLKDFPSQPWEKMDEKCVRVEGNEPPAPYISQCRKWQVMRFLLKPPPPPGASSP